MGKLRTLNGGVAPGDLVRASVSLGRNMAGLVVSPALAAAPTHLTWVLTDRCPMRCGHCELGRPGDELSHDQRIEVARRIGDSEVWGVSLTGGEPMVVRGVLDYAAILKRRRKTVFLSTSGYRLDGERLDRILEIELDYVVLSLDGTDADAHDRFRGRSGLYAMVCHANDTIRRRRRERPLTQVRFTIHRHNLGQVERFLEEWSERADNVQLQVIQDNGLHHVRDRTYLFRPEDRAELERVLSRLSDRYPSLGHRYYRWMSRYVFDWQGLYDEIEFRCLLVPQTSASLHPDGSVRLCGGRSDTAVGNLLREDLATIWRRTETERMRRRMQSRTFGCMCWESRSASNLDLLALYPLASRVLGV